MIRKTLILALSAALFSAAGWAQDAPSGPLAGFAPELSERHGVVLFETLTAVNCAPRAGGDPLGGARLDRRLGAALSDCTRLRIASAAAAALERGGKVRWRLDDALLRGAAAPGPAAEGRLGKCRTVRLETYSAHGDVDERTLTLCRTGAAWRVEPAPRRNRFSRSG
ncbi:MAG: hypothetical protein RKE49_03040 [Oceanicaulis sp.]